MDRKNIQSILQDALDDAFPTSQIDLLPRLQNRLVAGTIQQGEKMKAVPSRRISRVALVTLAVSAFLAIALLTPQGRALAQSLLRFFTRADGDTIPVPTMPMAWADVTPGVPNATLTPIPTPTALVAFAPDCGSFPIMSCSVEEIRSKVDFIVKEPASIPEGLYFTGATGGPDAVYLRYENENNSGALFITEERWTGTPDQGNPRIGASTVLEDVQVGKLSGEYYRGSFVQNGNANDGIAKWDPDATLETLRWMESGVLYTLEYSYTSKGPLGKEGLIAIAQNLTTEPVAQLPMPATPMATATVYVNPDLLTLKIDLAERQAGFNLMMPPRLPADLTSHGGASFNRATGVVSVWFTYDDVNMNGLYLNQQVISSPDECVLCDAVVGDDNSALLTQGPEIVGADADPIGGSGSGRGLKLREAVTASDSLSSYSVIGRCRSSVKGCSPPISPSGPMCSSSHWCRPWRYLLASIHCTSFCHAAGMSFPGFFTSMRVTAYSPPGKSMMRPRLLPA
jgi:hypothetical protein